MGPATAADAHQPADGQSLPWWPAPRARSTAGEPLTGDRIIAGALDLLRDGGGEDLTMRRLAAHLGVSPSTIYWWVEGRDHLLALVVDAVHGTVTTPTSAPGDTWADQLTAMAVSLYNAYSANPAVLRILAAGVLAGPNTIALLERFLAVLVGGAGLSGREAASAAFAILALVRGFIPQPSGVPGSPEAKVWTGGAGLGMLPARQFPLLAGLAAELESVDPGDQFRWALTTFVSSLSPEEPRR